MRDACSPPRGGGGGAEVWLGAVALVVLATSLGLARVQLFGPPLPLLQPYRAPVPAEARVLSLATAHQLFLDRQAVFLDAREPEAYAAAHIPGAVNVEPGASAQLLKGLPPGTLVVYCDGPECGASARLAARLLTSVAGPVAVLPDGFPAWEAAGYATAASSPPPR